MDNLKLNKQPISRRDALKYLGTGTLGLLALSGGVGSLLSSCASPKKEDAVAGKRTDKRFNNEVSMLAFGMMRLPQTERNVIDEELSQKLVDYAYAHGVNYYDTAFNYIGGNSEIFTGKALKKYPRESFYLATKMPTWEVTGLERAKELLQIQLDRLQTNYIDYYLLHALSDKETYFKTYKETGVLDYLLEEKAAGKIHRLGFSYHGDNESLKAILDDRDWDFVQLQINYYDWDLNDAKTQYKMLEERGIPCMVMEPIRGGMLAKLNPDAEAILKDAEPDKSVASWALRYVASLPGVLTVLSGMNVMDHVEENIRTLSTDFKPLTNKEYATLDKALKVFLKNPPLRCTTCKYCMPCEYGVDIPAIFSFYNDCLNNSVIPDTDNPKGTEFKRRKREFLVRYSQIPEESQAHHCIACGKCMTKCPQRIRIPEEIARIKKLVEEVQSFE